MPEAELLNVTPQEAVDRFRAKGLHVGFNWRDTDAALHRRSFTVAKAMDVDILEDIRGAVDQAISEGATFETFYDRLEPTLQAKGWWGRKEMTDPLTGERRMVQLGSEHRLRTIFDTNLRMSYQLGRWERIERVAAARPWLRYVAVKDRRTRDQHMAWHGTVLRYDHEFWKTHYPPNGWFCRCNVQQLSSDDLEEFGFSGGEPPDGWDDTRSWRNKRTGETLQVPRGIDPGFGHNVGLIDPAQAGEQMLKEKIAAAPSPLVQAVTAELYDDDGELII